MAAVSFCTAALLSCSIDERMLEDTSFNNRDKRTADAHKGDKGDKKTEALLAQLQADAHSLRLRASLLLMVLAWLSVFVGCAFFLVYWVEFHSHDDLVTGYVDVNAKYDYVPYIYIVTGIFGICNYLALPPNDLVLIRANAFITVILVRVGFHGGLFIWSTAKTAAMQGSEKTRRLHIAFMCTFFVNYVLQLALLAPAFQRAVSGRKALATIWRAERFHLLFESTVTNVMGVIAGDTGWTIWVSFFSAEGVMALLLYKKNRDRFSAMMNRLAARGEQRQAATVAHLVGQLPKG